MLPDFSLPAALLGLSAEWQACTEQFLRHMFDDHSHSAKTVDLYRLLLSQFFSLCNKHPEQVTYADVKRFLESPVRILAGNGGKPADGTRNMRQCAISSLYKFAAFYLNRPIPNPTAGMSYVKRQRIGRKRAFSEEELRAFFEAIPDSVLGARDYALFLCYFLTGKRREELVRLRYGDIEPWVFSEAGKSRSGYRFRYFAKGKGQEPQYQEMPKMAYQAIMTYLKRSGRRATMKPDSPLFVPVGYGFNGAMTYTNSNKPLYSSSVVYNFKRYLYAAGLGHDRRLTLHSLRHTAAQQHWLAKPDLLLVSKFLGHSNIATTQIYIEDLFGYSDPVSQLVEQKFSSLGRR
jgi:integrase